MRRRPTSGCRSSTHSPRPPEPRPGNLFFDWSRSVDKPNEFVLVEAFRDDGAGAAHVQSDHFKAAQRDLPDALTETPEIINVEIPDKSGWDHLAEIQPG